MPTTAPAPSLVGAPLPVATTAPLLAPAVLPAPSVEVQDAQGILLLNHRYPTSAEVFLLAVRRARHRTGIGRALLAQVEEDLRSQGVRLLSVKTLGPSQPDPEGYDRTRAFYQACGFVPVEEFPDLWPDNPCLLLVKVL
ncbi:GNAT family N-acetyltransferase [Antribacter gilvus]|uniref:GNAT family N-acetyltransferase n=1 Tax=Antribacter gilvus TaxID=2304675 RepID=UPI0013DEBC6D|nr:GNAT family N-acetyltransferase [Antribacter gilvus]